MLPLPAAHQLDCIKARKKQIKELRKELNDEAKLLEDALRRELTGYILDGALYRNTYDSNIYKVVNSSFNDFAIYLARTGNVISFGIYMVIPEAFEDEARKRKPLKPFSLFRYYDYTEIKTSWFWNKLCSSERDFLEKVFFN
jgi:hypothetical protein